MKTLKEIKERHEHDERVWTNHGQAHQDRAALIAMVEELQAKLKQVEACRRWSMHLEEHPDGSQSIGFTEDDDGIFVDHKDIRKALNMEQGE